jgi:hypothetical protein
LLVDDRAIVIVVSIEDDAVTLPVLLDVGQCVLALLDRLLAQVLAIKRDQGCRGCRLPTQSLSAPAAE